MHNRAPSTAGPRAPVLARYICQVTGSGVEDVSPCLPVLFAFSARRHESPRRINTAAAMASRQSGCRRQGYTINSNLLLLSASLL